MQDIEPPMDTQKFEASVARFKAHTLELRAKRRKTVLTTDVPKMVEAAAHVEKLKLRTEQKCRAKTMEGKQCGFRATCGEFCKKHAIKT